MPMSTVLRPAHDAKLPVLSQEALGQISTIIAALLLTVLLISFRPFQPVQPELPGGGGDIVNQLGFGMVGAAALCSLLMLTDRCITLALLSPWWLLLFGFLGLSVLNTPVPSDTMRSAAFSIIGIMTVGAVLTLPRDADAFSRVLAFAGLAVLGLSYLGLVALPAKAIHQAGEVEWQHAGLWRGVFTHKNIAGPVMANLSFAGIYLWRRGWRTSGGVIYVLAIVFVLNSGSKTAAATVAVATFLVMFPGLFGLRFLTPLLFLASLCLIAVATLGTVFIEPVRQLAQLLPDPTYTGRTSIWAFAGEMIAKRPWTGYGFENFWGTGLVLNSDVYFDQDWDIRGVVHSHDSYLDLALTMGLPALMIAVITFALVPARDYMRVRSCREDVLLADFFMMIIVFTMFNAFLESFFFRRVDPVWMLFALALLGLRLAARFPISSRGAK